MKLRFALLFFLFASCTPRIILGPIDKDASSPTPSAGIANPASVYCEQEGGRLEMRTDEKGNQYGLCILDSGDICEEWAFFNKTCPASP